MTVSTLRSQVDRLGKDVADLERKAADETVRATKEHGQALRVQNSISRTTSASLLQSKLREIQRYEESASRHEQKAAQYAQQAANKRRSLTSAHNQLEQALKRERDKEERDRKRWREEDLRHLRELEQSRRATMETLGPQTGHADVLAAPKSREADDFEYDVCLSFAGEERPYVEMVARGLKNCGARVFYDRDEEQTLWGKDLVEHFDHVYRSASRYCVMFISEAYAAKSWTRHERRSALARALVEEDEYVLPARFDDTELPGLPPTIGYVDLREVAPASLVEFVLGKLELAVPNGVSPGSASIGGDARQGESDSA
jgi:hypothetical protein